MYSENAYLLMEMEISFVTRGEIHLKMPTIYRAIAKTDTRFTTGSIFREKNANEKHVR